MHNFKNSQTESQEETVDFKKTFTSILDSWYWIVLSVIICLSIGYVYSQRQTPIYEIKSKLLLNTKDKGDGIPTASAVADLSGLMGSKASVENEIEILKTRFLIEQVVREMQLNITYSKKLSFTKQELNSAPFRFEIIRGLDTINGGVFTLKKIDKTKFSITLKEKEIIGYWDKPFKLEGIGVVKVTPIVISAIESSEYIINVSSIDAKVSQLASQLTASLTNNQVTIIDLTLKYPLQKKGEEILSTLIKRYKALNIEDKNTVADSTIKFIKNRLSYIGLELGDLEGNIQKFREKNKIADMQQQGKLLVENAGTNAADLSKIETQLAIVKDLKKYINDNEKNQRILPSSIIANDVVFSSAVEKYNSLLIERDKQLLSVTPESPFIKNIDEQIANLRVDILNNIESTINNFEVTRTKLVGQVNKSQNQIKGVPEIEKDYLVLARQQKIKEELYIFLMEKVEETAISKTSNVSVAKTIDPPKASFSAISPNVPAILAVACLIGLIIPIAIIFLIPLFDYKIKSKDDITNLTAVPVIGEINHNELSDNLIVANQGRSAISEQFRALRTNLSFYLKTEEEKVILLTSSMSGEGKSFTAINLANILALSGKKVLLMELDLRKPGLSAKLGVNNDIGFSNYTIDSKIKVQDIVRPLALNPNMFIISSGPLPPNPAETLMSENVPQLMKTLKAEFDYIIMDAPPIGIVTDAQLLNKYADVTLYLIRQNYTQKGQLSIVEDLRRGGKMKSIAIVVNDISGKAYGYGYGYGNYGNEVSNENLFTKLKNKLKKGIK